MKSLFFLGSLFLPLLAMGGEPLPKSCLAKAVDAVNRKHQLAEGSVYALRALYDGQFASVLLVGHSDETEETDYLVTVERFECRVRSIVTSGESSGVEKYTDAERVENVLR